MQSVAVITEYTDDNKKMFNQKCSGTLIDNDKVLTSHECVKAHVYDCKYKSNCAGMSVMYHEGKVGGYGFGSDTVHEIKYTFVPKSPRKGSDRGIAILVLKKGIKDVQHKLPSKDTWEFFPYPMIEQSFKYADTSFCALSSMYRDPYEYSTKIQPQSREIDSIMTPIECGMHLFSKSKLLVFNSNEFGTFSSEMCGQSPDRSDDSPPKRERYTFIKGDVGGGLVMLVNNKPYLLGVNSGSHPLLKQVIRPADGSEVGLYPFLNMFVPLYLYHFWIYSVFESIKNLRDDKLEQVLAYMSLYKYDRRTAEVSTPPSSVVGDNYQDNIQLIYDQNYLIFSGILPTTGCIEGGAYLGFWLCGKEEFSPKRLILNFTRSGEMIGMKQLTIEWMTGYFDTLKEIIKTQNTNAQSNPSLRNNQPYTRGSTVPKLLTFSFCTLPVIHVNPSQMQAGIVDGLSTRVCFEINFNSETRIIDTDFAVQKQSVKVDSTMSNQVRRTGIFRSTVYYSLITDPSTVLSKPDTWVLINNEIEEVSLYIPGAMSLYNFGENPSATRLRPLPKPAESTARVFSCDEFNHNSL